MKTICRFCIIVWNMILLYFDKRNPHTQYKEGGK